MQQLAPDLHVVPHNDQVVGRKSQRRQFRLERSKFTKPTRSQLHPSPCGREIRVSLCGLQPAAVLAAGLTLTMALKWRTITALRKHASSYVVG
eukprot:6433541-Pyramimonas_sp.AAC.1